MPRALVALVALAALTACAAVKTGAPQTPAHTPKKSEPLGAIPSAVTTAEPEWIPWSVRAGEPVPADPREHHLADLRRLTFGEGENAEPRWSPDGHHLVWRSTRSAGCDQVYEVDLGGGSVRRVSGGGGRATSGAFVYPRGDRVLFSSTLAVGEACSPRPDPSLGFAWALDPLQMYSARPDGGDRRLLIGARGYNAETAVAPDGSRLVFTSSRDGDLELYTARLDGSGVQRVTHAEGYDGGASFSPDGARLVWRASRPKGAELDDYRAGLRRGIVRPAALEIMVSGAEGQSARAVTMNGMLNLAPSYLPDSRRVIFASDLDASPFPGAAPTFDLYVVDPDGPVSMDGTPPLTRVTFDGGVDGSPVFSPDGKLLAFTSSRLGSRPGETNLFVARWVE